MAVLGLYVLSSSSWVSFGVVAILFYILLRLTLAYMNYLTWAHYYKDLPGDPCPSKLLGHLLMYPGPNEKGLKFQMERCDKYPMFHLLWISFRPVLIVHHPDTVKVLLKSVEPKPRQMGTVYIMGLDWLGEGLLIANGEKWARNRRLLTPAFHFDILQSYIALKNKAAIVLSDKIDKQVEAGRSFELFSYVGLASLDIILQCAFSYNSNCQQIGDTHPYVHAVNLLSDIWVARSLKPWFYSDMLFYMSPSGREFKRNCDYVHKVAEDIIEKRRLSLKEDGTNPKSRHLDFLDILLTAKDENDQGLTSLEIRNEVDTFLFEGHDTTTSGMCWTLYLLAKHPEHQRRCQMEIDELLKGRENADLEWSDLAKLSYLTQCIKESMRMYPPVTFVQRVTTKDTMLDGHPIPSGTTIGIQIYNLHHNKAVWDDPYTYKPERFSSEKERNEKNETFAFVPFSAGPRNCIGQHFAMNEMKIILTHILRRYELSVDPDHEVNIKIGVVLRTKDGIKVKAKRRHVIS
ncbi:ultra-long-chain fatty acid omega-hydroxylase-like isoform X2 [Ostrea edulis]|uniref:ultra-long-chain fatty acid omega-hydroxylase-like isoform X2 n=1 Tax=Ostrea edulis TaxID=37623 RepID=UPI0024AF4CD9|nr:ultra-long-chain fatty acid omega-hydroxylase-like isoform X2 [Ostrea edulis]